PFHSFSTFYPKKYATTPIKSRGFEYFEIGAAGFECFVVGAATPLFSVRDVQLSNKFFFQ
ncbi:MAG: hypothetical protein WBE18_07345, partial [Gammaproteobacteria bacterium]